MPEADFGSEYLKEESHQILWDGEEVWASYLVKSPAKVIRIQFESEKQSYEQYLGFNFFGAKFELDGSLSSKFRVGRSVVDEFEFRGQESPAEKFRVWNGWSHPRYGDSEWIGWQGMIAVGKSSNHISFSCSDGMGGQRPDFDALRFTISWQ